MRVSARKNSSGKKSKSNKEGDPGAREFLIFWQFSYSKSELVRHQSKTGFRYHPYALQYPIAIIYRMMQSAIAVSSGESSVVASPARSIQKQPHCRKF